MVSEVTRLQFHTVTYTGKTNMKADILSRKNQVNTQNDNKDIQLLMEKLWNRRKIAEIMMLRRNSIIEKTNLLKEI